jgi:hypothetical protein
LISNGCVFFPESVSKILALAGLGVYRQIHIGPGELVESAWRARLVAELACGELRKVAITVL